MKPPPRPWRHELLLAILFMLGFTSCSGDSGDTRSEAEWSAARDRMVRSQLEAPGRDVSDPGVLSAMRKVPRHRFVPARWREEAYDDHPLPIGYGQTISQPYVVAFMTEQVAPKPSDRILEIGTGSGYQAAILGELAAQVYTIEIVEPLARLARETLITLGYTNIHVRAGDGYLGWPDAAPFDAILVTCAPESVPAPLVAQLRDGGRMIIPIGPLHDQQLILLVKHGGKVEQRAVLPVRFVPMTGEAEKPRPR